MKTKRAVLCGALVWLMIFSLFTVLSFIPGIKDSETQQGIVIGIFIIPSASLGAAIYYKGGDRTNGLIIGLVMIGVALILDAIITVPFVEIPYNGRGYSTFFTNPLLWILVVENITVIFIYWKLRIKPRW